jgi:inner membrane protease subunit 1
MAGILKRLVSKTVDTTLSAAKFGLGAFVTLEYIGGFVVCVGPSMEPTVWTRDVLLTEHISPRLGRISRGDVIVARCPLNRQCICKRVVGVAGDEVKFQGQNLTIPTGFVWLEGDNKFNSQDSRQYGPVPLEMIRRRCVGKVYPSIDFKFDSVQYKMDAAVQAQ